MSAPINAVIAPFYPIAMTLIYYDQRIRREGYDIERMMQAAGMNAPLAPPAGVRAAAPDEASEARVMRAAGVGLGVRHAGFALAAAIFAAAVHGSAQAPVAINPGEGATPAARNVRDASLDEYRKHLQALTPIVDACAKARDTKTCDPVLVGQDDRVPLPGANGSAPERRLIRYGWLRVLLSQAQETDEPPPAPLTGPQAFPGEDSVRPPKPVTSQLLKDAETRLAGDLTQTGGAATPLPAYAQERSELAKVLAGRDFRNLGEESPRDTALERLGNWINRLFQSVARFGSKSAWIGPVLVWGLIGAASVGLVWGLMQLEKRWRIRLIPEGGGPAAGAASARDWQLWLEDARRAAAEGHWREAVHFVYWASISRLESRRLWPADRARTPREYLSLLADQLPRRPGLTTLTGSFERIWYGGRAAEESDYKAAEELASGLSLSPQRLAADFGPFCDSLLKHTRGLYPQTSLDCDTTPTKPPSGAQRIGGKVMEANLAKKVQPQYPQAAKDRRIQGTVEFTATINKLGDIERFDLVKAPLALYDESYKTVMQWKYRPTKLNGQPVDVITDIIVNYTLSQ